MRPYRLFAIPVVAFLGVLASAGCTDTETVYVTREPFNPPPDTLSGFLGYYTPDEKQTTCGNCHVDHQARWAETAHAGAYQTLVGSGGAQDFCYGCHTVSENGNSFATEGTAGGWNIVADEAYHDVQCESCHGPGFDHVQVPDVAAPPLAHIAVLEDPAQSCAACHSGEHHPYVEEWEQSRHAEAIPAEGVNPSCAPCHEGRAALKAWGVTGNYVERDEVVTTANVLGITCGVCHDPHGSDNPAQLRWPIATLDPEQNLCMQCHLRRTVPASGSSRGNSPHAPQGAVLLGDVGYQNPAYLDTTLLNASSAATHANLTANPRLCAGCHLFRYETTDAQGNFFQVSGHLFRPIPCYGPDGLPTDTITNCAYTATARSFKPCAASGCHATEDQASLALSVVRQRINQLSATLWVDVDGDRTIDPTDGGYLGAIRANTTDLNASAAPVTAADGAEFNVRTFGEDAAGFLYDNGDKSHTAHNPFIAEAMLRANIEELADLYGLQPWFPSLPPEIQQMLRGPLGASGKVPFPRPAGRIVSSR